MHLEMLIVLITTLAVAQIVLIQWKQRHFRSYQLATTLGKCLMEFNKNQEQQVITITSNKTMNPKH